MVDEGSDATLTPEKPSPLREIDLRVCRPCISAGTKNGWNEWDDMAVAEGKVFCPAEKCLITGVDTDVCKYRLEYLMLDGEKK